MTLYEQVKEALRKGVPPNHVAAAYGISLSLVERVQRLMAEQQEQSDKYC